MKVSELIGQLMIALIKNGDVEVRMDRVSKSGAEVRSIYMSGSDLYIEPVDH